jgi:hypothetical protein
LQTPGRCKGVVECPYCTPLVYQNKWYSTLFPHQADTHYALHVKLAAVWLRFHLDDTPNHSDWWMAVCGIFKGLDATQPFGGATRFATNSSPLSRLVNGVNVKKQWANPWMNLFLDGMRNQHRLNGSMTHMYEVSFAVFFNSAFQMREEDSDDEADV